MQAKHPGPCITNLANYLDMVSCHSPCSQFPIPTILISMHLHTRTANGGEAIETAPRTWRYAVPAGPAGTYRWAQRDDHLQLGRARFPLRPPLSLRLRARVSAADIPGTWGFGLWNDPFSLSFGVSGAARRLPALPNAAWYFFASQHNFLSFRDDLPANGFLAATFRSPRLPGALLALGAPGLALLLARPTARLLRRMVRAFVRESSAHVAVDVTTWNAYRLEWRADGARFFVNDALIHQTRVSPREPLGLVVWLDNQFAAFPPDGRLRMGTLPNPAPAWMDVEGLEIKNT